LLMMPKDKAILILEELISGAALVKKQSHANSPEFIKWYCNVENAIGYIFPEKKGHLARFKSIEYKMSYDPRLSPEAHETYFCDSLERANAVLQSMVEEIKTYWKENGGEQDKFVRTATPVDSKIIFVVHGRNEAMRKSMFEFLRAIGLKPLEWSEAVKATGEATSYVGHVLDKAFMLAQAVVVLMTPDDEAYLRKEFQTDHDEQYEKELTPQVRPNVLFEAGMAMGRDAKRTVLVQIGKLRPFSDVGGRHILRLDNSSQRRQDLAERLKTAGCDVNLNGRDWHTIGSFELIAPKTDIKEIAPASLSTPTFTNNSQHSAGLTPAEAEIILATEDDGMIYVPQSSSYGRIVRSFFKQEDA